MKLAEESGRSLQAVAEELGVHANQLRPWRNERLAAGSAEALARQKAEAAELSGWRDTFLAGGEAALKTRPADARDGEIGRLKEKVGDLTMANELLGAKIERLEITRPLARRRSRRWAGKSRPPPARLTACSG